MNKNLPSLFFIWFLLQTLQIRSFALVSDYCFTQISGTYSAISGGTSHTASDDAVYTGIAIGFTFNFNGTNYTTCAISTNGFITFGGTNPASSYYTPISGGTTYNGSISAMGRDLCPGTSPTLRSQTLGSAPNRTFTIQWDNWKRYSGSCLADNIDCQIILYETTNKVSIVYGVSTAASTSITVQVGLRGANNSDYNNRTTTTNWAATTAGGSNGATCTITNTIIPASGLTFTFAPRPTAPSGTPGSRCGTGSVALAATGAAAGEDYKWYDALSAGTLLQTGGSSYNTPSISSTTTYYVTKYNTSTLCESTPRTSVVATINNIPATPGGFTSSTTPVCQSQSGVGYGVAAVGSATSYQWTYLGSGATFSSNPSASPSITINFSGTATGGNLSVAAINACGTSAANTPISITVNSLPSAAGAFTTNTTTVCQGQNSVAYAIGAVGGATSYTWNYTGTGATFSGSTNSITINYSATATSGNLSVAGTNGCGTGTANSPIAITVNPLPGQPSIITGSASPCLGSSQGYSVTNVGGVTYTWSFPLGWVQTGGGSTNSVTVTVGAGTGNVQVSPSNGCGGGTPRTLAVTVSDIPTAPVSAAGSASALTSFSANWAASSGATTYYLDVATDASFISFVSGYTNLNVGNVTNYSVTSLIPSTTYYYRVRANNTCGTSSNSATITTATSNPVVLNYYCFSQTSGTYNEITGGTVHTSTASDEVIYSAVGIGFAFSFNGKYYSNCAISTNGFITFGGTNPATNLYTPISSSTAYEGAISPMGRDLLGSSTGELRSELSGTAPNRVFTIQWKTWRRYIGGAQADNMNFQIKLYESSYNLDLIYGSNTCTTTSGTVQVGLRGSSNADFRNRKTAPWSSTAAGTTNTDNINTKNSAVPASGLTFTYFAPPSMPTTTGASRCNAGTLSLSASGAVAGQVYKWYDAFTAGTLKKTSADNTDNTYTTASLASTTVFYVAIYNSTTSCEGPRKAVTATVLYNPATPGVISGTTSVCANNEGFVYSIVPVNYATIYNWAVPSGSAISSGSGTTSITVSFGSTSGNITVNSSNMCATSSNQTSAITVNTSPTAPTITNASRSGAGTVTLSASGAGAGESYKWYSTATGATLLQTGGSNFNTPYLTATTVYYVVKYYTSGSGCESGPRTPVTAFIYVARAMDAYSVARSTGITYTDIVGGAGTNPVTAWNTTSFDNSSIALDIGFNFAFDGTSHDKFRVSTEGFITFNLATHATGDPLPICGTDDEYSTDNSLFTSAGKAGTLQTIAPFYNNLEIANGFNLDNSGGNAAVHYQVSGSAPNRVLTVQWRGMADYANCSSSSCTENDGNLNFQVKLYETSNSIEFWYGPTMTRSSCSGCSDTPDLTYTCGLNSSTLSGSPTTAQLLTQQSANSATFSNAVQNSLSTTPAVNSKLSFTLTAPAVPGSVPGNPSMNFPPNGATNRCPNSIVSWNMGTGFPTLYDVYFGTTNPPPLMASNHKPTYYDPGTLASGTTYYWKIVPKNSVGPAAAPPVYSFTTGSTNSITNITSSAGTTFCVGTTSTLTPVGNLAENSEYNWTSPLYIPFVGTLACKEGFPELFCLFCSDPCGTTGGASFTYNSPGTYTEDIFVRGCNATTSCARIVLTVNDNNNSSPTSVSSGAGNPICNGTNSTLTPSGGTLGTGATYEWRTAGCTTGAPIATTSTLNVSPASTTTYYVRYTGGTGPCPNTTNCSSITVTVNAAPTASAGANNGVCTGTSSITMTGSTSGGGGGVSSAVWSGGGGLGSWNDNGTPTNPADDYFTPSVGNGSFTATLTTNPVCSGSPATSTKIISWNTTVAGQCNWLGATNNDWFTAANWCGVVPTNLLDPIVASGMPNNCDINAPGAVCRTLTINSGATLTIQNTRNLDVWGDWVNNGTFSPVSGSTITFKGNANQSVGGSVASITFKNLTIANTGASGTDVITLSKPITIDGTLTLTDGIINSFSNLLTISSTGTSTGGVGSPTNSFVSGPIRKNGITNGSSFDFPTGKGTKWARIGAYSISSGPADFTAEYFNSGYTNISSLGSGVLAVSAKEYWDLTRNTGSGNASVRLYWEDATWSGISYCTNSGTDLIVAHWPSGGPWTDEGSPSVAAGCVGSAPATGWVQSSSQSSFSPHSFGNKKPGSNPLPVELIYFASVCKDDIAYISWTTASEINNDYFTLEKSVDGLNFTFVATIAGSGNTSKVSTYEYIDLVENFSSENSVFYRLKQTDIDGNFKYSEIAATRCLRPEFELVTIMPNPTHNFFTVFFNAPESNEDVLFEIRDMVGHLIQTAGAVTKTGGNVTSIDIGKFSPGVYFVKIINREVSFVEIVIKN